MSYMGRLQQQIDEYAEGDDFVREQLTNEINEYIHSDGAVEFNSLSEDAQRVMFYWEEQERDVIDYETHFNGEREEFYG